MRGCERAATIAYARIALPSNCSEIIDSRTDSRDQFMQLRSRFPTIRQRIRRGPHLIRLEPQQMLALAVQRSHMRAEEFIRRTREKIAIERANVNQSVRRVVNRIDEHQRAGGVRQ